MRSDFSNSFPISSVNVWSPLRHWRGYDSIIGLPASAHSVKFAMGSVARGVVGAGSLVVVVGAVGGVEGAGSFVVGVSFQDIPKPAITIIPIITMIAMVSLEEVFMGVCICFRLHLLYSRGKVEK